MAHIALIDADPTATAPLLEALERAGHMPNPLLDGSEALERLRAQPPDAIVLAVELPQVSGYSLCNKIKRDAALMAIPLLLVSSQATAETFEEHKRLRTRAEAYGHKPYQPKEILALLASLVGEPEAALPQAPVEATRPAATRPSAVRFGEDPSVRDISMSPFFAEDGTPTPASPSPYDSKEVDFAASTQVLGPEELAAADADERGAQQPSFAAEQAWVEQALGELQAEPDAGPASPAEPEEPGVADALSPDPSGTGPEAPPPPDASAAPRDTELDPPARSASRPRRGAKKPTGSGNDLEEHAPRPADERRALASLRRQATAVRRALADAQKAVTRAGAALDKLEAQCGSGEAAAADDAAP